MGAPGTKVATKSFLINLDKQGNNIRGKVLQITPTPLIEITVVGIIIMRKILILSILILYQPVMAFDYKSYIETSFKKILSTHKGDFDSDIDIGISAVTFKYNSKIKFTNKFRELSKTRKIFLSQWAKALGHPIKFIEQYKSEFLVKSGQVEIWIPMQEQVIPYMNKEIITNQEFNLYYIFVGAKKGKLVFLGTEFKVK